MASPAARRRAALIGLGAVGASVGFATAWASDGDEVVAQSDRVAVALQTTTPAATDPAASTPATAGPADPGELVISGVSGTKASAELLRRAREGEIAGVILMGTSIQSTTQVRRLTGSLQAAAADGGQLPLLIMVDQEGGTVKRFSSARPSRSARSMAGLGVGGVRAQGNGTGRDLLARGVNVNLAPVADVPTTATNFLTTRTFGTTASAVARNACAFAGGLLDAGVVPALKHFPGLGAAGPTNTDDGKVTIRQSRAALQRSWLPYRQCGTSAQSIDAQAGRDATGGMHGGVPAARQQRADGSIATLTMMSSAAYSSLTGTQPAVLSKAAYDAARGAGASGPFITDALEATALGGRTRVAPRAVESGANLVLYTGEAGAITGRSQIRAHVPQVVIDARAAPVRALRAALGPR